MKKTPFTRREFLSTAGGTLVAGWGGLRVAAGAETPLARDRTRSFFVYGAHLYRPPVPPASQRRQMVKDFAQKYGLNTVRIYPSWAYQNPEPGRFDFSEADELLRYCDEFGLRVLMNVVLEDAPFWLEEAHPEARYVNAEDRAYRLNNDGDDVTAGWPGLCLDWPAVRKAGAAYLREMTRMASAHPSLYAYDCWNEPHIEASMFHMVDEPIGMDAVYCYCPQTISSYQRWLQDRYGTLEALGAVWVRRYASWTEIDPPRHIGPYMDWIDWRRFIIERETKEMRFRIEQVRAVDNHGVIESHLGLQAAVDSPIAIMGINPWELAKAVDVWGISYFPRWPMMGSVSHGMARLELTRSQAGSKPFWLTELQGGYSVRSMRPQDIRMWNWLAVAAGAKGIIYWTYHPDIVGPQADELGLVALGGGETERVVEAARTNQMIQAHWDILEHYRPRPEVALLFDQDCALLTFAMTGNELVSAQSYRGYYRTLWKGDLWADFIESDRVSDPDYKVIIVPWYRTLKEGTAERLVRFVEQGGTLILESGFGTHDERAFRNFTVPPYGLAQKFGYMEQQSFQLISDAQDGKSSSDAAPYSEPIYTSGHLTFTEPIKVIVKAHSCLTSITAVDATVVATHGSMPVACRKTLGRGTVYYIGTNLGASIETGDAGGNDLIRAILSESIRPLVTAGSVRPRLIEGPSRSLLLVCNESSEEQRSTIKVPARYRRARDLYSHEEQGVREGGIWVAIPDESVGVWQLD